MRHVCAGVARHGTILAVALLFGLLAEATAAIDGVTGASPNPQFTFTARADYLSTAEGGSYLFWGYALDGGRAQYPGPTLILNQGDTVTITLHNTLDEPVSLVFPGQTGVVATGGAPGPLAVEAPVGGSVAYTFTASQPGTYIYQSGSHPELQLEMGLFGVIVVRPATSPKQAYNHPDTRFDHEYLFLLTGIDPTVHDYVAFGVQQLIDNTAHRPVYWLINGRTAPDDLSPAGAAWLPTQPYNCLPMMHPGERLLMRVVNLGREIHPLHHHGNHARIIARDGRMLASTPGSGPDLGTEGFTILSIPGQTVDAIFQWTGKDMGWDIYGSSLTDPALAHTCSSVTCPDANNDGRDDGTGEACYDDTTHEYCPDHDKPIPVLLPEKQDVTFGAWWSGSPYLGQLGGLPPGEGGLNPFGAFNFMWHSHTEKELTNNNIFPGGMLTILYILPPNVPVP
ncbi:MAG: multicopper oxidase domain-containing protein [Thermodesulfobacteriota bacterium]